MGGDGARDGALAGCERYDPADNTWEAMPNMREKRFNAAATCVGPHFFVFGGSTDRPAPLDKVERIDARDPTSWEKLPSVTTPRQGAASAVLKQLPYVLGGHDGQFPLKSAERLNVDGKNAGWEEIIPMHSRRFCTMACTALSNDRRIKIFVFGGHDGEQRVETVEVYDIDAGEWEPVPKHQQSTCHRMETRAGAAVGALAQPDLDIQRT